MCVCKEWLRYSFCWNVFKAWLLHKFGNGNPNRHSFLGGNQGVGSLRTLVPWGLRDIFGRWRNDLVTFEKSLWITKYNLNADQMEKHSAGFKLEMIESETHLSWACQVQSKRSEPFNGSKWDESDLWRQRLDCDFFSSNSLLKVFAAWPLPNRYKCHHGNHWYE